MEIEPLRDLPEPQWRHDIGMGHRLDVWRRNRGLSPCVVVGYLMESQTGYSQSHGQKGKAGCGPMGPIGLIVAYGANRGW